MSRYIDADELMVTLSKDLPYKASVKRVLMQAPEADVVEVRHGEWIKQEDYLTIYGKDILYVCSECTAKYTDMSNYCPYCGAKMDRERSPE